MKHFKIELSHLDMEQIDIEDIPALVEGEIKIWVISLRECKVCEKDADDLTDEEMARACRFAREDDRQRFLLGHVALKKLIGIYTDTHWREIIFSTGSHGKPYWDGSGSGGDIHFNMSHSCECIVIAFSKNAQVGIDIEKIEVNQKADSIAKRFFHPQESMALHGLQGCEKTAEFYRLWTMKEAVLKGIGCGLSVPTESFYFGTAPEAEDEYRAYGLPSVYSGWRVRTVAMVPGYESSLAYNPAENAHAF